ncbi:MAG: metallophosphoesterase [Blastocatellia bacterium]
MKITTRATRSIQAVVLSLAMLVSLPAAAIPQGGAQAPAIFAVIGDTGSGDEAQMSVGRQMAKQRGRLPFDFVLMLGDNIYEKGEERYIKPRFETPYAELLAAGVKFHASLGNHDIIKGLEFQTNYPNFNMGGRRYYNFTRANGLVEFFALDTNLMTPEQLKWLESGLRASQARWKIVFCHHSIYSSARMHSAYVKLRAQLEPLYVKYGVSAVFSGHSHCYERIKPQNGVQYFTAGSGGEIKKGTLDRKSPLTAYGNDQVNIFLIVQASEAELKVEAIAADGAIVDTHSIRR